MDIKKRKSQTKLIIIFKGTVCMVMMVLLSWVGWYSYRTLEALHMEWTGDAELARTLKSALDMHLATILFCGIFVVIFFELLVLFVYRLFKQ